MANPPKPKMSPGYGFEWALKGGKWVRSRKVTPSTPKPKGRSVQLNPTDSKTGVNRFGMGRGKQEAQSGYQAGTKKQTTTSGPSAQSGYQAGAKKQEGAKTEKSPSAKTSSTASSRSSAPAKPSSPKKTVDQSRTMWVKKGDKLSDGTVAKKGYLAQYGKDTKKVTANVKIQTDTASGKKKGETYSYNKGKSAGKKK